MPQLYIEKNGIYVHIPFCASKCHYCDFNSYALGQARTEPYVQALVAEIEQTADLISTDTEFHTVFFGGGTPTMCSGGQLVRILSALKDHFNLIPNAEITSEANPGTITLEQLTEMREGGFNRVSFGVQAFDNALLRSIGRVHTCEEAVEAIHLAREAGFSSINADLMFGLPGQTLPAFRETLQRALALDVPHLSIYGLIVEDGTAFGRWHDEGKLHLPGDAVEREMYDAAMEATAVQGYEQYEISNFARPGFRCEHNQIYWRNEPYLGFGAGAVAYWDQVRRTNCLLPGEYIRRMRDSRPLAVEEETVEPIASLGESLMLGLRMIDGVNLNLLRQRHGFEVRSRYASHIQRMTERGLLKIEGEWMKLTSAGIPLANDVWAGFIA